MKNKKTANTLWAGAILVSLVLVLFSLIFVSCAKAPVTSDIPKQSTDKPDPVSDNVDVEDHTVIDSTVVPEGNEPVPEHGSENGIVSNDPSATETPSSPTESIPSSNPATPVPDQPKTALAETADMGRDYLDKIIFLGDSTTYGLGYYYDHGYKDLVPPTQVWTPTSGTLTLDQWNYVAMKNPETGEEQMLTDLVSLKQPEYLCITLGVNGVSFMKEDYFKQSYTSLVQKVQELSPNTTIILNSIYPVTSGYEAKNNGINNLKIEAANLWVSAIAQGCGVHYLDSASVLKNDQGLLPDSYTNGDGLHLNGEAFGLVVEYIRTHAC